MKNICLFLALLVTFTVTSQLNIKPAATDTVIWQASKLTSVPKVMRFTMDSVSSYTIYYQNAKYTSITKYDYVTTGDLPTTKEFYTLLLEVIEKDTKYNLELDGDTWMISKSLGSAWIFKSSSYFYLNRKQIEAILLKLK